MVNGPLPRLLIVDDNPSIHRDFREILAPDDISIDQSLDDLEAQLFGEDASSGPAGAEFDIEIDSAFQGEDAIELIASANAAGNRYFMAFVDVRMPPGIDGVQTIKRIWNIDPQLNVVICTAFSDYSWRQILNILGPSPNLLILRKPFESIEVRQMAMAMLVRQSQHVAQEPTGSVAPNPHEAMIDALMRSVRDGVAVFDHRGGLQQINPAGRTMLAAPLTTAYASDGPAEPLVALQKRVRAFTHTTTYATTSQQERLDVRTPDGDSSQLNLHLHRIALTTESPPFYLCVFTKVGDS